jgi:predicted nucleotidyltransferase
MDADDWIKGAPLRTLADRDTVREALRRALLAEPDVDFAYLHGSFAAGLAFRDVDVAAYVEDSRPVHDDPRELATRLSAELTRATGLPVDVRLLNDAPLGFQHAVLRGELLMARDDSRLCDYIERVGGEYMEFARLGREYLPEVLGR